MLLWRRVALIRTDVSGDHTTSIIRMRGISELGATLAVTSSCNVLRSSETSVLTRATQRHIPEDGILHSHCRENFLVTFARLRVACATRTQLLASRHFVLSDVGNQYVSCMSWHYRTQTQKRNFLTYPHNEVFKYVYVSFGNHCAAYMSFHSRLVWILRKFLGRDSNMAPFKSVLGCDVPDSTLQLTTLVALGPQANCNDWATTTCRRNLLPNFVERRVALGQRGGSPTVVNLIFLDRSCHFSFK
jgi:hypothetical protein